MGSESDLSYSVNCGKGKLSKMYQNESENSRKSRKNKYIRRLTSNFSHGLLWQLRSIENRRFHSFDSRILFLH